MGAGSSLEEGWEARTVPIRASSARVGYEDNVLPQGAINESKETRKRGWVQGKERIIKDRYLIVHHLGKGTGGDRP